MTDREAEYVAANNNEPANMIYAAANGQIRPEDTGLTELDVDKASENKASRNLLASLETTVQQPVFISEESDSTPKPKAKVKAEEKEIG